MQQQKAAVSYVRRLGAWSAAMMVIGGIIGAGIFLNPAIVAKDTGSGGEMLLAWVLGGVLALIGALCFAELGVRQPQAGGGYVYLRNAYGPLLAFVYGWLLLAVVYSGALAAVGYTFATYFCAALNLSTSLIKPITIGMLVLLVGINWFGIRAGALVQNLFTVLKLLAVAALVVLGLWLAGVGGAAKATSMHGGISATHLSAALLPVLFSYSGWDFVSNIVGEIREPRRNLPLALGLGMLGVVVCYVCANLAYLAVLGHDGLAGSSAPAADVMQRALGPVGARLISAGIAISTFGFCNIALLSGARMFQVMGADGVFFRVAGRLHPRWHSPDLALVMLAGWSAVLALSGTFGQLLDYATVGAWLGYALVVTTLHYYRRRDTGDASGYRLPWYPYLPLLFIIGVAWVIIVTIIARPTDAGAGALIALLGVPLYLLWRYLGRRHD